MNCEFVPQRYICGKNENTPQLHTEVYVIGNPPYVNTHDMSKATVSFLKNSFATTQSGVFNIFYAFIEHGLNQLSPNGYLEFIVPNNFLTIKSAESLRSLLQNGQNICSVLDFADNMIFKPVRTYNCIIKLSKKPTNKFKYATMDKTENIQTALSNIHFNELQTIMLNRNGWILVDEKTMENISRIEHQKFPIKSYIRTGIATLRDGVYFVDSKDGDFFKIVDNEKYRIDAAIVKPIYKIPGLKYCKNAKDAMQHIIFPYKKGNNGYELIPEEELEKTYQNTYAYLLKMKPTLDERDKGKGNSSAWYAYGRTQGLNKYGKKLLFPTFASYPKFIYIDDENALFWVLLHNLCKREKWHKIQHGNRAGKSQDGLTAHNCILAEITGHVKGGCFSAAVHFTLDRNRDSCYCGSLSTKKISSCE